MGPLLALFILLIIPLQCAAQGCYLTQTIVEVPENNLIDYKLTEIRTDPDYVLAVPSEFTSLVAVDGTDLILKISLDFEEKSIEQISLNCMKDGSIMSRITFILVVLNINDNPPVFPQSQYRFTVPEDLKIGNSIGPRIEANDKDNEPLFYELKETNMAEPDHFRLTSIGNALILVKQSLDYDKFPSNQLLLMVRDTEVSGGTGSHTATATIHIEIVDVDNVPPRFMPCVDIGNKLCINSGYKSSVIRTELATGPLTFSPGPIHAVDGDASFKPTILYNIVSGNDENIFSIDTLSGNITMAKPASQLGTLVLQILCYQQNDSLQNAMTTAQIEVKEKNIHPPQFEKTSYLGQISSGTGIGSFVIDSNTPTQPLQVFAADEDFYDKVNPSISYTIVGENNFAISRDGYIRVNAVLASPSTIPFTVIATDSATNEIATTSVTVEVTPAPTTTTPAIPTTTGTGTTSSTTPGAGSTTSTIPGTGTTTSTIPGTGTTTSTIPGTGTTTSTIPGTGTTTSTIPGTGTTTSTIPGTGTTTSTTPGTGTTTSTIPGTGTTTSTTPGTGTTTSTTPGTGTTTSTTPGTGTTTSTTPGTGTTAITTPGTGTTTSTTPGTGTTTSTTPGTGTTTSTTPGTGTTTSTTPGTGTTTSTTPGTGTTTSTTSGTGTTTSTTPGTGTTTSTTPGTGTTTSTTSPGTGTTTSTTPGTGTTTSTTPGTGTTISTTPGTGTTTSTTFGTGTTTSTVPGTGTTTSTNPGIGISTTTVSGPGTTGADRATTSSRETGQSTTGSTTNEVAVAKKYSVSEMAAVGASLGAVLAVCLVGLGFLFYKQYGKRMRTRLRKNPGNDFGDYGNNHLINDNSGENSGPDSRIESPTDLDYEPDNQNYKANSDILGQSSTEINPFAAAAATSFVATGSPAVIKQPENLDDGIDPDDPKEVKSILSKTHKENEIGYKAVWFLEGAEAEVVVIEGAEEGEADEDAESEQEYNDNLEEDDEDDEPVNTVHTVSDNLNSFTTL